MFAIYSFDVFRWFFWGGLKACSHSAIFSGETAFLNQIAVL